MFSTAAQAQRARTPIHFPELPGYLTLKCDFHLHTVFSDGLVWPSIRSEEAWRDGLDAIAITDHLEYQPHKAFVSTNHDDSYGIARNAGEPLGVMVVKGSEVTRNMPPGHLNAIFLTNSTVLAVPKWQDAIEAAHRQDAFIFWNHPGWEAQAPGGKAVMYPEHKDLIARGRIKGIEVVNGGDYYPEAHGWAIEHNLTMFANSDMHSPRAFDYSHGEEFRPVTLVFAKDRTPEALKEALIARRTVVYSRDRLIGTEELLKPLFERSLTILNPKVPLKPGDRRMIQIHNNSDVSYRLELVKAPGSLIVPREITLLSGRTVLMEVRSRSGEPAPKGKISLEYKALNVLSGPNQPLNVRLGLEIQ